ncbi:hypothetical protein OG985_46740 [Streptomyces sp. NBC_00289]|uniref:hypothetical protein n=1 Tax=Streptomyces sp. NBC_00289 TaxID=2975703 RepID=UPI0032443327
MTEAGAEVKRRERKDLPPGRLRLASPYDTGARYGLKQGSWWTGYKIHEPCDDADAQDPAADGQALIPGADGPPPHLITGIATTDATVTDAEMAEPVHARCPRSPACRALPRFRLRLPRVDRGDEEELGDHPGLDEPGFISQRAYGRGLAGVSAGQ